MASTQRQTAAAGKRASANPDSGSKGDVDDVDYKAEH